MISFSLTLYLCFNLIKQKHSLNYSLFDCNNHPYKSTFIFCTISLLRCTLQTALKRVRCYKRRKPFFCPNTHLRAHEIAVKSEEKEPYNLVDLKMNNPHDMANKRTALSSSILGLTVTHTWAYAFVLGNPSMYACL